MSRAEALQKVGLKRATFVAPLTGAPHMSVGREVEAPIALSVEEVREWPGVWAVTRTFVGWILFADPRFPEDAVGSARKLADSSDLTVTVQGLVFHP